jgi:hypothetical protein
VNSLRFCVRLVRVLFLGFLFSWVGTSVSMHELDLLIHSPFEKYMAHDLFYGYESARTFYEFMPHMTAFHFCMGALIGIFSKPGDIKI